MKKNISVKIMVAAAAAITISACNESAYPGYEKAANGLYAKFYKHDEKGVKPVEGDLVRVSLLVKNNKDSVLADSRDSQFNRPGMTFYEFILMKPEFAGSFEEGLLSMAVGDSASFLVSVDSMYKSKEIPPFLEKGSMLTYEVALQKITGKAEVEKQQKQMMEEKKVMLELRKNEEIKSLAKYIEDNKIKTKPTASGLYYIEKAKGKGPNAAIGDTVEVNYTGRLLDGTVFDTSDEALAKESKVFDETRAYGPIEFIAGQIIEGWNEALSMMSPGAKAQLIIPSALAYGERGAGPLIPPYSPLIFELELINVKKAK